MPGKDIRLKRLFRHSGKLFIVPMDHGVTVGPVQGLEDVQKTVKAVFAGGADAIVIHKGLVKEVIDSIIGGGDLIVHLSASTALSPYPNHKEIVSTVEHAIRLGAGAISVHVNLAPASDSYMLKDLGTVAEECYKWGMPLLAMMYVRDGISETEYDPVKVRHAARIAEELGADIVKVNYTGSVETFQSVTRSVKIPVVIAGGPKVDSPHDLFKMTAEAMKAGAAGVAYGRNIFQVPDPAGLSADIRKILDSPEPEKTLVELLPRS